MNYDDYPHPIRRSPRATHELQQVFHQLQLENNRRHYDEDEDDSSDSDEGIPPPIPRRRPQAYDEPPETSPREPPPRSPSHVNPLRSHPVAADNTPTAPALKLIPHQRFSHPFREQFYAMRQPDPAPRRHPTSLVSYKPANKRLHPRLRKRTSLDTIASVTTTASILDPEDVQAPSPDMFTPEDEYVLTPDTLTSDVVTPGVNLGPIPRTEPPKPASLPGSLRTASVSSTQSIHPVTPVASAETYPPRGILRKLKPGKRKDSAGTDAGAERLVIERTVSVDQTSHHSDSSSASNTISSGTPSQYPHSKAGNSQSSSQWSASSHDTSGLTVEELKRCKKKGINPALFAEMKAARKGKWTSPIAGNTFLS